MYGDWLFSLTVWELLRVSSIYTRLCTINIPAVETRVALDLGTTRMDLHNDIEHRHIKFSLLSCNHQPIAEAGITESGSVALVEESVVVGGSEAHLLKVALFLGDLWMDTQLLPGANDCHTRPGERDTLFASLHFPFKNLS